MAGFLSIYLVIFFSGTHILNFSNSNAGSTNVDKFAWIELTEIVILCIWGKYYSRKITEMHKFLKVSTNKTYNVSLFESDYQIRGSMLGMITQTTGSSLIPGRNKKFSVNVSLMLLLLLLGHNSAFHFCGAVLCIHLHSCR